MRTVASAACEFGPLFTLGLLLLIFSISKIIVLVGREQTNSPRDTVRVARSAKIQGWASWADRLRAAFN